MNTPILLFYSYSHKDEVFRDELVKHLTILRRSGLIQEWHDRKILAGEEWDKQISTYLDTAEVILLLISSDFMASEYCYDVETKRALERSDKGEACLIPIILRPVEWKLTPFSKLQALPKDALPVSRWADRDLAYVNICEGILAVVTRLKTAAENFSTDAGTSHSPTPFFSESVSIVSRKRVLDSALPDHITVGKTAALVAMIRSEGSDGLRKILQINTQYGVTKEDVLSSDSFPLKFTVDSNGELQPLDLTLKIESPDFEPKTQSKSIRILPRGDSDLRIFLLTPQREGELFANLELCKGDLVLTGCLLTTQSSRSESETVSLNLISTPLRSDSYLEGRVSTSGNKSSMDVAGINSHNNEDADYFENEWRVNRNESIYRSPEEQVDVAIGHEPEGGYQSNVYSERQYNNRVLTGMFKDRESAERAYSSLESRGYSRNDVNLMMSDETRNRHFGEGSGDSELGSKALEGAGIGSAIGGTLGAIIGGIAAIGTSVLLPGLGLIIAGPLAATIAGAGAGSLTGGLVGALVGSGIPEDHAQEYEEGIRNGGIVMILNPRTKEDADYFENEWSNHRGENIYR